MSAAHSAVVLKAENMAEKTQWLNKLRSVISSKGGEVKGESGPPVRHSLSDGSLVIPYTSLSSQICSTFIFLNSFICSVIFCCIYFIP